IVSLPTTIAPTLLLRRARSTATRISSLFLTSFSQESFLPTHAPTVTFRPSSAAIGGISLAAPVDEYVRMFRVYCAIVLRSARICADACSSAAFFSAALSWLGLTLSVLPAREDAVQLLSPAA